MGLMFKAWGISEIQEKMLISSLHYFKAFGNFFQRAMSACGYKSKCLDTGFLKIV